MRGDLKSMNVLHELPQTEFLYVEFLVLFVSVCYRFYHFWSGLFNAIFIHVFVLNRTNKYNLLISKSRACCLSNNLKWNVVKMGNTGSESSFKEQSSNSFSDIFLALSTSVR